MTSPITVRHDFPHQVREIEHQLIVMPDGCQLSARLWLPVNAEQHPVPAILEHLPYRKRDGTVARDCLNHPWFAGHGYACIRVDMRGNGDSQGLMDDEYTHQELQDACDVIQWTTEQPWCSGSVGMMGISWGGFNSLQVASLRPPALKAIVTTCSTVDRFADDIHFKGGCLLGENIGWAANMLSYSSRPPDPLLVGDQWRALWLDRLENLPFLATRWIGEQRRSDYWKHGSVCEDYSAINAAVLAVGGWHDGYRNTIAHLVENIQAPVKGIVGPWIHKYPNYAAPEPRIGFLQECLRWWDRWLKGIENGAEHLPDYRAYQMDSVPPAQWYDKRPGHWIAERQWPSSAINASQFVAVQSPDGEQKLHSDSTAPAALHNVTVRSPAHCGSGTGEYFPFTFGPELPGNQQVDDAFSTCFDTERLTTALGIIGAPSVQLQCSANTPLALLAVRLCEVFSDGRSALISHGMLNLTHAASHENPERLASGKTITVTVTLDQIACRVAAGNKLRLAFSTQYWPFLWPSPELATVTLEEIQLSIPVRQSDSTTDECTFEQAETAAPWNHEVIREANSTREQFVEAESGIVCTRICNDFGENKDLDHQLVTGSVVTENWRIHPDDPLTASVDIEWQQTLSRQDWQVVTFASVHMQADAGNFYISGLVTALKGDEVVFEREYEEVVPRLFV